MNDLLRTIRNLSPSILIKLIVLNLNFSFSFATQMNNLPSLMFQYNNIQVSFQECREQGINCNYSAQCCEGHCGSDGTCTGGSSCRAQGVKCDYSAQCCKGFCKSEKTCSGG